MTLSARLIGCRIMIARLGERDLLNWWDSEALTPAGRIVLGRLFPRTGLWAAAELAMETAVAMHRSMMPHSGAYNLFYLGESIEQQLTRIIHRQKVPVSVFTNHCVHIEEILNRLPVGECHADWITFLTGQLAGGKPDSRTVASWQKKVVSGTVCVSENTEAPVTVSQWNALLDRLLAGYTISDPGKLIVPYFTVKGNGTLSLPAGEVEAA